MSNLYDYYINKKLIINPYIFNEYEYNYEDMFDNRNSIIFTKKIRFPKNNDLFIFEERIIIYLKLYYLSYLEVYIGNDTFDKLHLINKFNFNEKIDKFKYKNISLNNPFIYSQKFLFIGGIDFVNSGYLYIKTDSEYIKYISSFWTFKTFTNGDNYNKFVDIYNMKVIKFNGCNISFHPIEEEENIEKLSECEKQLPENINNVDILNDMNEKELYNIKNIERKKIYKYFNKKIDGLLLKN